MTITRVPRKTSHRIVFLTLVALSLVGVCSSFALAVDFFPADFDMDGDVDEIDLVIWDGSFGLGVSPIVAGPGIALLGDADGDGDADIDDLFIWKRDEGSSLLVAAPTLTGLPEVIYNKVSGALSVLSHGADIYALILELNGSHVLSVSNSLLPSSTNGAWDLRSFGSSIQGFDASMLAYTSPVMADNTLDELSGPTKIADLSPGLMMNDFGPLRYGLQSDDSVGDATLFIVVPEPGAVALVAMSLWCAIPAMRRRR